MRGEQGVQGGFVEQVGHRHGIGDGANEQSQCDGHVAEGEIQIDDAHLVLAAFSQRHAEVRRQHGLAAAPFALNTVTTVPTRRPSRPGPPDD